MSAGLQSAQDVAQHLGVPDSWVYGHAAELGAIRVGRYVRFPPEAVESYIEAHRTTRTPEQLAAEHAQTHPLATSRRSVGARRAARTRKTGDA